MVFRVYQLFYNKKIMILQLQHKHSQQQQPQQFNEGVLGIFESMLDHSQQALNEESLKETQRLRRFYQQKVYLSYCDDPSQYLFHMLHKSQSMSSDHVAEMIMGRQNKVVTAIKNDKYQVKINNQGQKLKKIKDQLTNKISQMKNNFANLEVPSPKNQQKSEQLYNGYMEFRKKGYWKQKSQQSKKAHKFLSQMKKMRVQMQQQHEKNLKKSQEAIQQQIQKERKMKEEQKRKFFQEFSKRRQKIKSERKNKFQQHKQKLNEASSFLQKFKTQKPIYILNQQKFKKQVLQPMQQQKKRKLSQIKKNHKPIDAGQLELHSQRYEQFRQKLLQAFQKRDQDKQLYEKNMQKLKQLYHGRFHQKIIEEMNHYQDMIQQKRKMRERINSYSEGIKQEFKPKVDLKKKQQLQSLKKLLQQKSLEKGKKKIKKQDGTITYEQVSPRSYIKLGDSYLQYLKKYNQGKKRKEPQDRSASMMDLSKKKISYPDYLQEMRSKSRVQTSTTTKSKNGWRKIISQDGFTNRDKYNSVMDHVSLLEHEARQKELELKYMKGGVKAMQLKQKVDKYYLQSVAAKMHILKDVILKQ